MSQRKMGETSLDGPKRSELIKRKIQLLSKQGSEEGVQNGMSERNSLRKKSQPIVRSRNQKNTEKLTNIPSSISSILERKPSRLNQAR